MARSGQPLPAGAPGRWQADTYKMRLRRFFGSLKSEWTHGQCYTTREQARRDVIEHIEMHYNSDRLHSSLDYTTPREWELVAAA